MSLALQCSAEVEKTLSFLSKLVRSVSVCIILDSDLHGT